MHYKIIGLNLLDNNYNETKLHKACIASWQRLVNYFERQGDTAEIKIYGPKDYQYKQFVKRYNLDIEKSLGVLHLSNAFRIYLMSKQKNVIWLDTDVYITEDIDKAAPHTLFVNDLYMTTGFCILYNAERTKLFKQIEACYNTPGHILWNSTDKQTCEYVRDVLLKDTTEFKEELELIQKSKEVNNKTIFTYFTHLCHVESTDLDYLLFKNKEDGLYVGAILKYTKESRKFRTDPKDPRNWRKIDKTIFDILKEAEIKNINPKDLI